MKKTPKTVKRSELSTLHMVAGGESKLSTVIQERKTLHRMHWVGIGWVDEGEASAADLEKFPLVVDEPEDDLALDACRALVAAYRNGKKNGGSVDWSDVDAAHSQAVCALKAARVAKGRR